MSADLGPTIRGGRRPGDRGAGHLDDARRARSGREFDAFASYTTSADYRLVRNLEGFLESFHRLETPEELPLHKLEICVDGSDFSLARLRSRAREAADGLGDLEEETRRLIAGELARCRYLLVFCPGKERQGPWVDWELEWFLEYRGPDEIFLAVTHGEAPWESPEGFFPARAIAAGLHRKIWYDLRGYRGRQARPWQKVRDFDDERTRLAADLNGHPAGAILPIWHREEARSRRRRRAVVIAASTLLILAMSIIVLLGRNYSINRAIASLESLGGEVTPGSVPLTSFDQPGFTIRLEYAEKLRNLPQIAPELRRLDRVVSLDIAGVEGVESLRPLEGLEDLTYLQLMATRVRDLAPLRGLHQLGGLGLRGTRVDNASLADLAGLSHLKDLDLSSTRVDDEGLARLSRLDELEVLHLGRTEISDAGLAHLDRLPLRQLYLDVTRVGDDGLARLAGHRLEVLDLSDTMVTSRSLEVLRGFRDTLKTLYLGGTSIPERNVAMLRDDLPGVAIESDP